MNTNTFTLNLTVTKPEIEAETKSVLTTIQKTFQGDGFRPGKAPLDVVKQKISSEKLLEEVLNSLLPRLYRQAIINQKLKPVTSPKITIKNPPFSLDKDWNLTIDGAQAPDITINPKFFTDIKSINQNEKLDKNQKTDEIIKKLLEHSKIELAPLIIENDLNHKLSDLVTQTQQAGITVENYLKSRNLTIDQYRHQLEHQIIDEWTINLAISHIATDKNIKPDQKEIDEVAQKNPQTANNPDLIFYLLTQQKVVDYLLSI